MAKKVISFLGASQMTETTYSLESRECRTCFMAEASARFFTPDKLLVVVTAEARDRNLPDLKRRLADFLDPHPVNIPSGKTEEELWTIFNAIASVIDEDTPLAAAAVPNLNDIRAVWAQITPARNSVAHLTDALTASEIEQQARIACSQLRLLLR
jgi:hypothetical protein